MKYHACEPQFSVERKVAGEEYRGRKEVHANGEKRKVKKKQLTNSTPFVVVGI